MTSTRALHRPAEWPDDAELQRAVRDELDWSPQIDASGIGVSAEAGVVRLDGAVRDAAEDAQVRKAVFRVRGVVGVVDRLRTAPPTGLTDEVLLDRVVAALRRTAGVPADVHPAVRDGVIILTGTTAWHAEREAATRTVERLGGVRRVENRIVLTPRPSSADAADRIRAALVRSAAVDAGTIAVRVDGTEVVLEGSVRSDAERRQAVVAAWASPNVTMVHDRIRIVP
ncbi:BON domain-containing protein [Amnibacterium kyonggiense]|uniref:Osmotically-inducible protein OsmY n=1 Tax=Amnibacterium kyonggiense TaxID=595671 RepID=A0A4R7FKG8_9MICO|nr:BON domain-containing protein [Amnibacterium kyonggiense]TDS76838.1 osmotically-inducible protein OsmY [Amnibacterium kyonggiense]